MKSDECERWLREIGAHGAESIAHARDVLAGLDEVHESYKIAAHLLGRLQSQTKPNNWLDAGAEIVAAHWLLGQGELDAPPDFCEGVDAVLDLGIVSDGFGLEVKHDRDSLEPTILYGRWPDDPKALAPLINEHLGRGRYAYIDWIGVKPGEGDIAKHLDSIRQACERALLSLDNLEEVRRYPHGISVNVRCLGSWCFVLRLPGPVNVRASIKDGFGWGGVCERICEHAANKASKTSAPFVLCYVSFDSQRQFVTPQRLQCAWREIANARAQNGWTNFKGVVCLDASSQNINAYGKFFDAVESGLKLSLVEDFAFSMKAGEIWQDARGQLSRLSARYPEVGVLSELLNQTSCDDRAAKELFERCVVDTARVGLRFNDYGLAFKNPFPCDGDEDVSLEHLLPSR